MAIIVKQGRVRSVLKRYNSMLRKGNSSCTADDRRVERKRLAAIQVASKTVRNIMTVIRQRRGRNKLGNILSKLSNEMYLATRGRYPTTVKLQLKIYSGRISKHMS